MNAWKAVASLLPGPIALWAAKWFALFSGSDLIHPRFQSEAESTALGFAVLTSLAIAILLRSAPMPSLTKWITYFFAAVVLLGLACYGFHWYLDRPLPPTTVLDLWNFWKLVYIVFLVVVVGTVTLLALAAIERTGSWAVIIGIIAVSVAAGGFLTYLLFRYLGWLS